MAYPSEQQDNIPKNKPEKKKRYLSVIWLKNGLPTEITYWNPETQLTQLNPLFILITPS